MIFKLFKTYKKESIVLILFYVLLIMPFLLLLITNSSIKKVSTDQVDYIKDNISLVSFSNTINNDEGNVKKTIEDEVEEMNNISPISVTSYGASLLFNANIKEGDSNINQSIYTFEDESTRDDISSFINLEKPNFIRTNQGDYGFFLSSQYYDSLKKELVLKNKNTDEFDIKIPILGYFKTKKETVSDRMFLLVNNSKIDNSFADNVNLYMIFRYEKDIDIDVSNILKSRSSNDVQTKISNAYTWNVVSDNLLKKGELICLFVYILTSLILVFAQFSLTKPILNDEMIKYYFYKDKKKCLFSYSAYVLMLNVVALSLIGIIYFIIFGILGSANVTLMSSIYLIITVTISPFLSLLLSFISFLYRFKRT